MLSSHSSLSERLEWSIMCSFEGLFFTGRSVRSIRWPHSAAKAELTWDFALLLSVYSKGLIEEGLMKGICRGVARVTGLTRDHEAPRDKQ